MAGRFQMFQRFVYRMTFDGQKTFVPVRRRVPPKELCSVGNVDEEALKERMIRNVIISRCWQWCTYSLERQTILIEIHRRLQIQAQ